jgi:hypothetical protein
MPDAAIDACCLIDLLASGEIRGHECQSFGFHSPGVAGLSGLADHREALRFTNPPLQR